MEKEVGQVVAEYITLVATVDGKLNRVDLEDVEFEEVDFEFDVLFPNIKA